MITVRKHKGHSGKMFMSGAYTKKRLSTMAEQSARNWENTEHKTRQRGQQAIFGQMLNA